ncbi:unnamed protein product [Ostreobium quekettii]|uniref:Peptidase S54 rhomboid domain-containing protein n=1 Tax=Ostreobium quekettii TaxID=121088 RepID=A0A8S1IKA8_9CHLO|nr:unnamed protein product [Ostreobium quekettii]|eukprot:evm.model.scf_93.6 EVM.evm.TU.scf_93.6   scf_93:73283-74347(+)
MDRDPHRVRFNGRSWVADWLPGALGAMRGGAESPGAKAQRKRPKLNSDAAVDQDDKLNRRLPQPTRLTSPLLGLSLALFAQSVGEAARRRPDGRPALPSGTAAIIAANAAVFLAPGGIPSGAVCLAPSRVVERREFGRLVTSALVHLDLAHLTSNMRSVLDGGSRVEALVGPRALLLDVVSLTLLSQGIHVASAWAEHRWLGRSATYRSTCSVGFSSTCFALNILAGYLEDEEGPDPGAGLISPKFLCWANLILSQVLFPAASMRGHLCGIVAGLARVYAPWPFLLVRRVVACIVERLWGCRRRGEDLDEKVLRGRRCVADLWGHVGLGALAMVYLTCTSGKHRAPSVGGGCGI